MIFYFKCLCYVTNILFTVYSKFVCVFFFPMTFRVIICSSLLNMNVHIYTMCLQVVLRNNDTYLCVLQRHQQELSAVFPNLPVLDCVRFLPRLCLLLWLLHTDGRRHHTYGQWTGVYLALL